MVTRRTDTSRDVWKPLYFLYMTQSLKASVAKDVFAYLLTFIMLYIGVINLIGLVWQIISAQFPDPATYGYSPYDSMRNSIASLIVVWPIFLLMTRYIVHDLARIPEKVDLWVRRWLTYLTIFVAALTIIIDLITLLNSFLGGELTMRFVLKVLVVLLVDVAVLGYEFWELKRKPGAGKKEMQLMIVGSVLFIFVSIIGGFIFVGTPTTARQQKLDSERLSDLQNLQSQIVSYWNQTQRLPVSLNELKDPLSGFVLPLDPETNQSYTYTITGDLTFELCSTFAKETPAWNISEARPFYMYDQYGMPITDDWTHKTGYTCFSRTIDPELHTTPKIVN